MRAILAGEPEPEGVRRLPVYDDASARFLIHPADRPVLWDALDADGSA